MVRLISASIVPSFFTMANMFCGFYSVLLSTNDRFIQASWLIVAAAVLDTLDGQLARMTKTSSPFGVQYDSLADVVSFGLAPSILVYKSFFHNWGTIGLFLSFVPLVFGSIRLARFNVRLKGFDKDYFEGLPIPAAAISLATFIIFNFYFWERLRWSKVMLFLMLFVSLLMISNIRYEVMPNFSFSSDRITRIKIMIFIVGTMAIVLFPQETFFPIIMLYVFSGPIWVLWRIFNYDSTNRSLEIKDHNS